MSDAMYVEVGIRLVNSLSQCAGRSLMSVPKLLPWLDLIHTCTIRPTVFCLLTTHTGRLEHDHEFCLS